MMPIQKLSIASAAATVVALAYLVVPINSFQLSPTLRHHQLKVVSRSTHHSSALYAADENTTVTQSSQSVSDDWIKQDFEDQVVNTNNENVVRGPTHTLIYDTTLRDGTQMESISASCDDKLKISARLSKFDVDYIEAGWPGSNPKDEEFFHRAKTELDV